ncbi:MAG: DUF2849 domain-containing protein [Alphaproteobacteria bacterium HGW-Alphaproteobacteria-8]|jgi:hypothetical protein|nr:MAG: DUF2849 domain-containing protein [Alphaproteobacteria bacterium HGW-Alphaproteobacteria-8]
MSRAHIVSANDLLVGDVVYFTAADGWTRKLEEAALARTGDEAEALLARATRQQSRVVDPYLAEVALDGARAPRPLHFREVFRTRGPSHRTDLGRQAEN